MSRFFAHLFAMASWAWCCMAGVCPTNFESDICDLKDSESAAHGIAPLTSNGGQQLVLLGALALRSDSAMATLFVVPFLGLLPGAKATSWTCATVSQAYQDAQCCNLDNKSSKSINSTVQTSMCPYNFAKPACNKAEPQAPRDLTQPDGNFTEGMKVPKSPTLTPSQVLFLSLVNVHFHFGAEHKANAYMNDSVIVDWDGNTKPEPGYMCEAPQLNTTFKFQYCENVTVGYSYEVHYVHSSAGYSAQHTADASADNMDDGLGGAANGRGLLNPTVAVEAQVFLIVDDDTTGVDDAPDLVHGWKHLTDRKIAAYQGSTTGPSHDDSVCSPYAVSWHVDLDCHKVKASDFDKMCKAMKDTYKMKYDLKPHGSRRPVNQNFVVKSEYILVIDNGTQV